MKRGMLMTVLVGALVAAFALGRAQAQDGGDAEKAMQEAMMKAWMDLGTPGPQHAEMKEMVGDWECDVKSWEDPNKPPEVTKGKTSFKMVLGGLMLEQQYEGSMMGHKFTGLGYTAFNKATGKYEAIWMDSMSSGILKLVGEKKDGVIEYKGHFFGPGGAKIDCRYEMSKVDEDKHLFVMYMDMGMGMNKSMEMTYNRVKK